MTDLEKRVKTKMIESEYAKKLHQLEIEESIAHINGDRNRICEINDKKVHLGLEMELDKNLLDYEK